MTPPIRIGKVLAALFKRPSITVQTYHVHKTDWEKKRDAKCKQLAAELGMEWRRG